MKDMQVESSSQFNFEAANNQRERLLALLKERPVTTIQAREIGIMSPAARILELRGKGYPIETRKAKVTTADCVCDVAEYVLLADGE